MRSHWAARVTARRTLDASFPVHSVSQLHRAGVDHQGLLRTGRHEHHDDHRVEHVKGGSTVPLKFELFAGSTELTDISAVSSFQTAKVTCDGAGTDVSDAIEITTTGGTSLRYDSTGGQFIQNWKTTTTLGCYRATMTADDGSTITAFFKILK
jgi:hypothetical protein